ncbi:hypothetical protein MRX96_012217 [Rhipicephalus microplus]
MLTQATSAANKQTPIDKQTKQTTKHVGSALHAGSVSQAACTVDDSKPPQKLVQEVIASRGSTEEITVKKTSKQEVTPLRGSTEQITVKEKSKQWVTASRGSTELITVKETSKQEVTASRGSPEQVSVKEKSKQEVTASRGSTEHVTVKEKSKQEVTASRDSTEQVTVKEKSKQEVTASRGSTEQVTVKEKSKQEVTALRGSTEQVTIKETSKQEVTASRSSTEQITVKETSKQEVTASRGSNEQVTVKEKSKQEVTASKGSTEQITVKETSKHKRNSTSQASVNLDPVEPKDCAQMSKKGADKLHSAKVSDGTSSKNVTGVTRDPKILHSKMETTLDVDKACVDIVDSNLRIEKTTCNVDKAHVVDVADAPLKIEKMAFEAGKACADVADVAVKTLKRSNSARENRVDDNEAKKLDFTAAKVNKTSPMGKGASESSPPKSKATTSGPEVKGTSEPIKKAVEVPSSASSYSAHTEKHVDTGRRGSTERSEEKKKDKKDHPPGSRQPAVDDKETDKPDSRIRKEKKRKSEPSPRNEPASKKRASEEDSPRSKKSASKGSSHRLPKTDSATAEHKQPLSKQEKTKSEKPKKESREAAKKTKEEIILDPKERERLKSEALEKARKEGSDCIKVKTPDRKKEISWPMSLIRYTNSKPFISYGCNPIYGKIGIAVAKEKGPVKSNSEVKEEKKEIQEALKEPAKKDSRSREHKPKDEVPLVAPVENKVLSPPKEVLVKESEVTDVVSPDLNAMSGLQALQCLYDNMDSPETAVKELDSETEVSHREADQKAAPEETPSSDQCESVESDTTGQHCSVVESTPPSPEVLDAKQPSKCTPPRSPPRARIA